MDFRGQASPFCAAYLTWAMLDAQEIISFLHPIPKTVFIPTTFLTVSLE